MASAGYTLPSGSPASGCSGETEAGSGGAGIRTPPRDVRGVARLLSPCSAARCPGGARCDTLHLPRGGERCPPAGRAQPVPGPEGPITSGLRASTALVRYPRRPPTTSWSPQVLQTGVGSQGDRPAWPLPTGWFHKNLRCSHISVLFICFSKLASASSEALI